MTLGQKEDNFWWRRRESTPRPSGHKLLILLYHFPPLPITNPGQGSSRWVRPWWSGLWRKNRWETFFPALVLYIRNPPGSPPPTRRISSTFFSACCPMAGRWGFSPNILIDWRPEPKNRLTFPLGLGVGRTFKINPSLPPIQMTREFQWMPVYPEDFGQRFNKLVTHPTAGIARLGCHVDPAVHVHEYGKAASHFVPNGLFIETQLNVLCAHKCVMTASIDFSNLLFSGTFS